VRLPNSNTSQKNSLLSFFRQPKIALQLLFWVLMIEFPAEAILVYISYTNAQKTLQSEILTKLEAVSERQTLQIEKYIQQELDNLSILSQVNDVVEKSTGAINEIGKTTEKTKLTQTNQATQDFFTKYKSLFGFSEITVVSPDFKIAFSTDSLLPVGASLRTPKKGYENIFKAAERASILLQTDFSDFVDIPQKSGFSLYGAAPLRNNGGRFIGVILVEIKQTSIAEILNDYTGLGETGESVLVFRKNAEVFFATHSRFKSQTKKSIPFLKSETPTAIYEALQGNRNTVIAKDHLGNDAITFYSYIPPLRSGILVKINTAEAYAPIHNLRNIFITIISITLVIVVLVAIRLADSFTKPLRALTRVVHRLAEGDLSQRSDIQLKNEIGVLAEDFNLMAQKLQDDQIKLTDYNQSLEAKVEERTKEVQEALDAIKSQNIRLNELNEELVSSEEELRQNAEELSSINDNLFKSEQRFKKLIEENDIGICIVDYATVLYSNQAAQKLLGYNEEQFKKISLTELVSPKFAPFLQVELDRYFYGKADRSRYELKIRTQYNSKIWVDMFLVRIDYEGKNAILVSLYDITSRRQAENMLKESERTFRAIFENIQEGYIMVSEEGKILMANQSLVDLMKYSSLDEIYQHNAFNFYADPHERTRFHTILYEKEKITAYPLLFKRKDGELIYIEFDKRIVRDELGQVRYFEGLIRDVTEKKKAENELRNAYNEIKESRRNYAYLLRNLKGLVYRMRVDNTEGKARQLEFVSDGAYELTGYRAKDFMDQRVTLGALIEEADRKRVNQQIRKAIIEKSAYELTYRMRTHNNQVKWVFEKGGGLYDDGVLISLQGFITDIDSQKKIEEELMVSREMISRQKERVERNNEVLMLLTQSPAIQLGKWEEAVSTLLQTPADYLGIDRVSLWTLREGVEPPMLDCVAHFEKQNNRMEIGQSYATFVMPDSYLETLSVGDSIIAPRVSKEPLLAVFQTIQKSVSAIHIPYFGRFGLSGTMVFENLQEEVNWQADDVTFLKSLTDILTIAYKSYQRALAEEEVLKQKQIIEKKNDDIIDSINYASRIQAAILPPQDIIETLLKDFFILYKPRDIVSGDFYWIGEVSGKTVVAAVDCTGHGVPGAFMSMIATQLLYEIVSRRNVINADEILNNLHISVRKALKQESTQNRDGMDVSLVVYDPKKQEMQFSGAKNPIVFFQNQTLHYIKGDVLPIGGEQREVQRVFKRHSFNIDTQTTIYLFSDGFQDQFGGADKKKFLISNLRQLLTDIHLLPMEEQKRKLNVTIEEWMLAGKERQMDDILMLGFRLG